MSKIYFKKNEPKHIVFDYYLWKSTDRFEILNWCIIFTWGFQHVSLRNYLKPLGFVNVYEGIKYTTGHLPRQTEYIARIIILADNHKFKLIDPLVKIFCVEDDLRYYCLGKTHLFVLNLPTCLILCILIRRETEYMVTLS